MKTSENTKFTFIFLKKKENKTKIENLKKAIAPKQSFKYLNYEHPKKHSTIP